MSIARKYYWVDGFWPHEVKGPYDEPQPPYDGISLFIGGDGELHSYAVELDSLCGHLREDTDGEGEWECTLEAGHDGTHDYEWVDL